MKKGPRKGRRPLPQRRAVPRKAIQLEAFSVCRLPELHPALSYLLPELLNAAPEGPDIRSQTTH